jgi:two-component system response regulator FixJ
MSRHALKGTVVVVGGRGDVRAFIREQLADEDYAVEEVEIPCSLEGGWLGGPVRCVILELSMPQGSALDLLRELRDARPDLPVIATIEKGDVPLAVAATRSGAVSVLERPLDRSALVEAVVSAADGLAKVAEERGPDVVEARLRLLTPREREVLRLVVAGLPSKEIARLLQISKRTIDIHRAHLLRKLDARSVIDLVRTYLAS